MCEQSDKAALAALIKASVKHDYHMRAGWFYAQDEGGKVYSYRLYPEWRSIIGMWVGRPIYAIAQGAPLRNYNSTVLSHAEYLELTMSVEPPAELMENVHRVEAMLRWVSRQQADYLQKLKKHDAEKLARLNIELQQAKAALAAATQPVPMPTEPAPKGHSGERARTDNIEVGDTLTFIGVTSTAIRHAFVRGEDYKVYQGLDGMHLFAPNGSIVHSAIDHHLVFIHK